MLVVGWLAKAVLVVSGSGAGGQEGRRGAGGGIPCGWGAATNVRSSENSLILCILLINR